MKNLHFLVILLFAALTSQAQLKLSGITLPASIPAGKDNLVLNGGGIREKYFMDMYVGGLYLLKKSQDAKTIVNADELMAVKLHIVSGMITSEKMITAINEGFANSTGNNTAPLKSKIEKFTAVFNEGIAEGDIYDLIYIPSKGVAIFKNGKLKETIDGIEFKKALFGIWLGEKPADSALKSGMLGK